MLHFLCYVLIIRVCAMFMFCLILLHDLYFFYLSFVFDAGRWLEAPFYLFCAPSLTYFTCIMLEITSGDPWYVIETLLFLNIRYHCLVLFFDIFRIQGLHIGYCRCK